MEGVLPLPRAGSPEAEVDVVVAGAGPVGLLLGCILQRAGVNAVVVDPHIEPGQQAKAAVTMPRSFEVMDLVGAGAEAAASGRRVTAMRIGIGHSWLGQATGLGRETIPSRYGAVATGQPNIERVLSRRFQDLGGRLFRAARFGGYAERGGGVEVTVQRDVYVRPPAVAPEVPAHLKEPRQATFKARYLVGCDGKQSAVRAAMGVGFSGKEYPQSFFLADAVIDQAEEERCGMSSHQMMFVQNASPPSVLLLVHMHGRNWRVYYCARGLERSFLSEEFLKEKCRELLPKPGPPEMALHDVSFYKVDCRLADDYRKGPCMVAGDAAHCHSPAGGQGMNTGLQDAANLGWKLAAILRHGAPESLLESYGQERRPCAEWVLSTSDKLFQALMDQSSATMNVLRRAFLKVLLAVVPASALPPKPLRERIFGLSISYAGNGTCRDLGGSPPRGAVAAGQRLPDLPCAVAGVGERYTLQLLEGPPCLSFLLLYVACFPPQPEELRSSLEVFRAHSDAGVLLRPCIYVAPAPCCLSGCLPWPEPAGPKASDGRAERAALLPKAGPASLWPPLRLAPEPGRPHPTLAAALRLPMRGRALLVVRPDGYVAVVQRGSWSAKPVAQAMEDLSLWPRVR